MDQSECATALTRLIGEILADVAVTRYIHEPSDQPRDQRCYFRFAATGWVEFRTSSDGYGLRITAGQAPESIDMQDAGLVYVARAAEDAQFAGLVGKPLEGAKLIVLPWSAVPIGVQLNWTGRSVLLIDWGDELLITNQLPDYVVDGTGQSAVIEDLPALE